MLFSSQCEFWRLRERKCSDKRPVCVKTPASAQFGSHEHLTSRTPVVHVVVRSGCLLHCFADNEKTLKKKIWAMFVLKFYRSGFCHTMSENNLSSFTCFLQVNQRNYCATSQSSETEAGIDVASRVCSPERVRVPCASCHVIQPARASSFTQVTWCQQMKRRWISFSLTLFVPKCVKVPTLMAQSQEIFVTPSVGCLPQ